MTLSDPETENTVTEEPLLGIERDLVSLCGRMRVSHPSLGKDLRAASARFTSLRFIVAFSAAPEGEGRGRGEEERNKEEKKKKVADPVLRPFFRYVPDGSGGGSGEREGGPWVLIRREFPVPFERKERKRKIRRRRSVSCGVCWSRRGRGSTG